MIVAVDDPRAAGLVGAGGAGREPDRCQQPAAAELNAVPGADGQYGPGINHLKGLKGRRDIRGRFKASAAIVASPVESASVITAV